MVKNNISDNFVGAVNPTASKSNIGEARKFDCEKLSIDFTSQYICCICSYIRVRYSPYHGFVLYIDRQSDGRMDGRTNGWMVGRTD